jgi:hypothetical protein
VSREGPAKICDAEQRLCLAFAFWNEHDPILKERIFGLAGHEGNHGPWYAAWDPIDRSTLPPDELLEQSDETGTPCETSRITPNLQIWRSRRVSTVRASVSPSMPQFQLRLSLEPSRLPSPYASLCLEL